MMPANGARLTMIFEQRGSIPVLQVRIIQLMHKIHYTRFLVSLVYILSTVMTLDLPMTMHTGLDDVV